MSGFSKIFNGLLKWIEALVKKIVDFVKKHWKLILLVVIICTLPALGTALASMGAPAFLTTWMTGPLAISVSSYASAALSWVAEGTWAFAKTAWAAAPHWSIKAALVVGAVALIAPDETAEMLSTVLEGVVEVATDLTTGVVQGLGLNKLFPWLLGGAALFLLMNKRERAPVLVAASPTRRTYE